MPAAHVNGLTLEYETLGNPSHPAVLLVMGLGGPMIMWEASFCQALVDAGFFVVRYDNRDCGKSTKLDDFDLPDVLQMVASWMNDGEIDGPYRLSDMAADAAALLDAIGLDKAHVVGASMGGMSAQTLASEFPSRGASLTSIMASTG